MPRKNRTFNGKDILRIFRNNLDIQDKAEVLVALCKDVKVETFDGKDILVPTTPEEEAIIESEIVDVFIDLLLSIFVLK